jgi:IMP dehydrogenase
MLTFNDVLILPKYSEVGSRRNVDISTKLGDLYLPLPIISSNMATVTGVTMARKISEMGGLGLLHRFCSVDENVALFKQSTVNNDCAERVGCSVGVGQSEQDRTRALVDAGCRVFCVDVAHGAQLSVTNQVYWMLESHADDIDALIVGNFAIRTSIKAFMKRMPFDARLVFKVGIGPGAACTTRVKTGVGVPQLSAIIDCVESGYQVIADGGCRTPSDVCKSLAAGGSAVMLGYMLAGTDESPGQEVDGKKVYRGSAAGGYAQGWKTSEGVSMQIESKGSVQEILLDIEGGLRSSMSYVNARNLGQYRENVEFVRVTGSTVVENRPVSG